MLEHVGVEHHGDAPLAVVDERERRDAAGRYAEHALQQLGAAEGEARRAEPGGERVEVEAAVLEHHHQPQPALAVLEEQALAMPVRRQGHARRAQRRSGGGCSGPAVQRKPVRMLSSKRHSTATSRASTLPSATFRRTPPTVATIEPTLAPAGSGAAAALVTLIRPPGNASCISSPPRSDRLASRSPQPASAAATRPSSMPVPPARYRATPAAVRTIKRTAISCPSPACGRGRDPSR